MRAALLILLFCLAQADDIRWEFEQFKSQVEAALNLQISQLTTNLTLEIKQMQNDYTNLNLEIAQLKSQVKKLAYQCPIGWVKFGSSCYYLSTEKWTWQHGRDYCHNRGADLVVINSREKQDFVASRIGRGQEVWIGLTDGETEGEWKWIDGTPVTSPTYWRAGEPDNWQGAEDCGQFYNGGWSDTSCGTLRYWMCEIVI